MCCDSTANIETRLAQLYERVTEPARVALGTRFPHTHPPFSTHLSPLLPPSPFLLVTAAKLEPLRLQASSLLASFRVTLTIATSPTPTAPLSPSHVSKPSPLTQLPTRHSALLPFITTLLLASGVLVVDLLRAQPERHTLRFGEVLRVGERRQYR